MSNTRHDLADALYGAGYTDRQKERDYDPRATPEWQAVVDAIPSPDFALPTEMGEILRKASNNPGRTANDIELLTRAADECDRFYGGMMNWKANAQAKDRTIIELGAKLAKSEATSASELADERTPLSQDEVIELLRAAGVPDNNLRSLYAGHGLTLYLEHLTTFANTTRAALAQQAGAPAGYVLVSAKMLAGVRAALLDAQYLTVLDKLDEDLADAPDPAAQDEQDAREFVTAIAHNYDVYDEGDDERYCRGCSALVAQDGATNHQPDCIVPRAQAWLAAMSQSKTQGAA